MKPYFQHAKDVKVVDVKEKAVAIVGLSVRDKPSERRLWGFDALGNIVVLTRYQWSWQITTDTELDRPCHRAIVSTVRNLQFKAGMELGKYIGGGKIRPIRTTSNLIDY